jgi:internalin A
LFYRGQNTHHIFFTKNSLYFLIWEELTNSYNQRNLNQIDRNGNTINLQTFDYPIFYWLDSIKHFIKDKAPENFSEEMKEILKGNESESYYASSLVIKNKVNSNNKLKFLNNETINDKYPFIYDFINIDLHNEKNLATLIDSLNEMIDELGKLTGGEYPIYYQKIKDNVQEFKSYNGKKILNFNEFKRLCQAFKRNLTTDEEFIDIAYFLKDIGLILISKDKKTFYLDLNHLSHQIIKIYDKLDKTGGVLNENEISGKNIDEFENILKLIIDFNMAFVITKNNIKNYVFPLFLPDKASKIVGLLLKDNLKAYKRIQYKGFMHKGIILHIFSEYSNKIVSEEIDNNTYYWKNGLIVKENDNLVLIKFFTGNDSKDAYIDLYNFGSTEVFIESIKERIVEINKTNNYDVKEYVSADGLNFIPLELIHTNEENKNEVFLNKEDLKYYRLYDFKKYLKNKNNAMKKVFLSYSRQNLKYKESLKTHLSILERYGLLKAWSCEDIVAGKWNQQIQKELEEADIIVYMVSADFMSSSYIMEQEVKKGIELIKKNPEKKIICVLVGVCQWKNWSVLEEIYNESRDESGNFTMDLSKFQFLPYHQYKDEQGVSTREEIIALEKWGRHPYDVINEAYNQIVSKIFDEIKN